MFDIPTNSGILNQESQTPDHIGGFHVLNRENTSGGEKWLHYHRSPSGTWSRNPINAPLAPTPTPTGSRGSLAVDRENNLYAVLPGNLDSNLSILRSRPTSCSTYGPFEVVWQGDGYDGEPLVDTRRLDESDILSVFTRTLDKSKGGQRRGEVVVLDFD